MKLRAVSTLVVAAVAVTGLSGCDSKVGLAAEANGIRITDSDLSDYVTRSGPSAAVAGAGDRTRSSRACRCSARSSRSSSSSTRCARPAACRPDAKLDGLHDEATQRFLGNTNGDPAFAELLEQAAARQYGLHAEVRRRCSSATPNSSDTMVNRVQAANHDGARTPRSTSTRSRCR